MQCDKAAYRQQFERLDERALALQFDPGVPVPPVMLGRSLQSATQHPLQPTAVPNNNGHAVIAITSRTSYNTTRIVPPGLICYESLPGTRCLRFKVRIPWCSYPYVAPVHVRHGSGTSGSRALGTTPCH